MHCTPKGQGRPRRVGRKTALQGELLSGRIDKQAMEHEISRRGNDASGFSKRQSACSGSTAISIPGQQCHFLWASQSPVACLESQVLIHAGCHVSLLEAFCLYVSSSLHFSLRIQVRPRHFPSDKPDFAHRNHSLASIEVVPTKQP